MDKLIVLMQDAADSAGGMNILDIVVAAVIAVCIFVGYHKGLIRAVFDLVSTLVSLFIASRLYPMVSVFLREKSGIYERIKDGIVGSMNLNNVVQDHTLAAQEAFINSLPLPEFLADILLENNNPEIYSILNVSSIEDYVGGFFASIVLNILSAVLVFIAVFAIMKIITATLDLVSRLPVIHQFNKTGGLVAGFISGLLYTWLGLIIYTMFFLNPQNMARLYSSTLALFLYEHNFLLFAIIKIFA